MTWEAFHRRGDVLRTVIAELSVRRDGTLPTDLPGVSETFHDELDLLGALQLRWYARLTSAIEHELSNQPMDLDTAVIDAWRATADALPGIREVLDHHRAHPVDDRMAEAMGKASAKERQMLAVMAGRVSAVQADAHGAREGSRLEEAARNGHRLPSPRPAHRQAGRRALGNPRFLDRLRAALAA